MYCQLKITLHAACVDIAGLNEYCNFCGLHLSKDYVFMPPFNVYTVKNS